MTLRRQVLLWSGAILLLSASSFAVFALQIGRERDAGREASRVRGVIVASASVAKLSVDLQTGARAFVGTGQERFLAPHTAAVAALPPALAHLRSLTRDPRQRERLADIETTLRQYADFTRRVVAIARRDRPRAFRILAAGGHAGHLGAIGAALDAFDDAERAIAARTDRDVRDAEATTVYFSVIVFGAVALILGVFTFVILRRVVAPIVALSAAARGAAEGDLTVTVRAVGSGEIGHLVDRFNAMTRSLDESSSRRESANRELEAFAYSVSHDLRGPLRAVDGFAEALDDEYADRLDDTARDYLGRIRGGAQRMGLLIDALLDLSRIGRADIARAPVDITAAAHDLVAHLRRVHPQRDVEVAVQEGLVADADPHLTRVVLQNLIGNAWKFTRDAARARIEVGATRERGRVEYFVRDNGAGFDMAYADKLFSPFQRLHSPAEFAGSGVGLATVARIVARHGGEISAVGRPGEGATFRFTLE